ncbi:hypothetical protein XI09_30380 [Bradyrhizobium sp. CCBAU 11386]|nr:hypothetical protein [Bradyrhizobium sp. CCBAU 11386]
MVHKVSGHDQNRKLYMPEHVEMPSDIVAISRLNGDFRRNYGLAIGAFLFLRSLSAARGRSFFWAGLISIATTVVMAWLARRGSSWLDAWI